MHNRTPHLQLSPKFAFVTADTVHYRSNIPEMFLELFFQLVHPTFAVEHFRFVEMVGKRIYNAQQIFYGKLRVPVLYLIA